MSGSFERAVALHQAGRVAEAQSLYRQAIALAPRHADALRLLGLLLLQMQQPHDALDMIERARALQPKSADVLLAQGMAFKALGRLDEAIAAMRRALRAREGAFDILYNLGNAQREAGRLQDAAASLRRAVAAKPDFADAHNNLGTTLRQLGEHGAAVRSFAAAVALMPGAAPLHFNLAAALALDGRDDAAVASHRAAVRLAPDVAQYHHGLGEALSRTGLHAAAVAAFEAAVRLEPGAAAGRLALAQAYAGWDRLEEAVEVLRAAVLEFPDHAELHSHLGNLQRDLDQDAAAVASLETALRLQPDYAPARYVLGVCHLLAGRLDQGWPGYAARFAANDTQARFANAAWRGEAIAGQTLLLQAEQGLGDTIQFCRYVTRIAEPARIVLEVQPALLPLLGAQGWAAQVVAAGAALPAFDRHCALLDLPLVFGTTLQTIPAETPYLVADPVRLASWQARCKPLAGIRVGLCWGGNRDYAHDAQRSVPPALLGALGGVAGVTFVSLQKESGAAQERPDLAIVDWTGDLHDLADTAALIAALDLVISVDTAVVHLAGALGRPVWLLNRAQTDWRWLRERTDSPWYPTLRQFRQSRRGEWRDVLTAVATALEGVA